MFNPRLLTLARQAVGLTEGALAIQVGVSQALLSKIENGLEQPSTELLKKVAKWCEVPLAFFEQNDEPLGESLVDVFHKKRLTLPAKPLKKANAQANKVRMEIKRLVRSLELNDTAPFPSFPRDEHDNVEEITQLVRATWSIPSGPMPDLISLIEATGVPVLVFPLGHEKLAAISMPGAEPGGHIIVLNQDLPPSARRFALAHELGHLVMHSGVATSDMEREADAFASALLMPAADIKRSLRNVQFRDLGALKSKWRVSLAALIYRAHDLGEITDRHYRSLNIQLNQLPGGRKREPGEFTAEEPRLIRHIIEHYRVDLGYSPREVADVMIAEEISMRERYLGEPRALRIVANGEATHRLSVVS